MCKWLNKTPIYKLINFYFFKLSEKFVKKRTLQNLFLKEKIILVKTHELQIKNVHTAVCIVLTLKWQYIIV